MLPPTASRNSYLAATIEKHKLLAVTPSPRVIILGGSNTAFGFDSATIQQALSMPVVNMGLHGGLGLRFALNEYIPHCEKGDIVIVSPEYPQFEDPDGDYNLLHLLYLYPRAIRYLAWQNICSMPKAYKQLQHFKLAWWRQVGFAEPPKSHVYNRFAFNSFGDEVGHKLRGLADQASKFPALDELFACQPSQSPSIELLKSFRETVEAKGAKVYFAYPPLLKPYFEQNTEKLAALDKCLRTHTGISVISTPERDVFEKSDFYDTTDHLNWTARSTRTQYLIWDLTLLENPLQASTEGQNK